MKKIHTLFVRNPEDRRHVLDEVTPGCEWVLNGEGVATRKYDGTCVMFDGGFWWSRREVKPGGRIPGGFIPLSADPNTGKTMGWEPIEQSSYAKWFAEAVQGGEQPGTYELVGPKINGNPEHSHGHALVAHDAAQVLDLEPEALTFDMLKAILSSPTWSYEGIVWHHPDGRMVKLKRRDFL